METRQQQNANKIRFAVGEDALDDSQGRRSGSRGKPMFHRMALLLLLSLGVCGAQAAKRPLPMPIAAELPVEVIEAQQEIGVSVPETASAVGMQFGLVGALIGSAVQNAQTKKAEARIVPLRNLMVDYRFNQKVAEALEAKLPSEGVSPHPQLTVMPTTWEARDAQQTGQLPPMAMVITPSYSMDSDFSQLTVTLLAEVVDRTIKSNGKVKATKRFSRAYAFHYPLVGQVSDDPVRDWAALGTQGMSQLLDQGVAQATDMLVHDLSPEGRFSWGVDAKGRAATLEGKSYPGAMVRRGDGWMWLRTGRKTWQKLDGYRHVTAGAAPAMARDAQVAATGTPAASAVSGAVDAAGLPDVGAVSPEGAPAPVPSDNAATPAADVPAAESTATATPQDG